VLGFWHGFCNVKDNVPVQGTNYFGTFLLTHLLLDKLKQTAQEKGHARYEDFKPAGQLVKFGWHGWRETLHCK
jgi:hypothetical protein